jgi:hypothetical protein
MLRPPFVVRVGLSTKTGTFSATGRRGTFKKCFSLLFIAVNQMRCATLFGASKSVEGKRLPTAMRNVYALAAHNDAQTALLNERNEKHCWLLYQV